MRPLPVTSLKNQVIASIIIGLSVFLILALFQPFGTFGFTMPHKFLFLSGYGVVCSLVYSAYYALAMLLFKRWFAPAKWNIVREMVTIIPVLFIISLVSLYYHHGILGGYEIRLNDVFYFFRISMAVAVIPFSVLFYRKHLLSNLTTIEHHDSDSGYLITFDSNNKNEKPVTVASASLLYVKSDGNYIEIAVRTGDGIKNHLLRNSLNQVECKLPSDDFIRIHRSYIANACLLESVSLSGSSYSVRIKDTGLRLPVSRSMVRTVRSIIPE
jgi:hypothetical protein